MIFDRQPRTNPDGDVDLRGANYNTFNVPSCRICEAEGEKPTMVCLCSGHSCRAHNIDPGETQRGIFREVIMFISQRYKLTSAQRYRVKLSRQLSVMNHSLSSTLRPPFSSSVHPSPLTLPSASLNWRLIRKSLCS